VALKWRFKADRIFEASALLIVAGFLLMPLTLFVHISPLVGMVLSAGVACFDYLFSVPVILGRRPRIQRIVRQCDFATVNKRRFAA
jgi:hypothetical protein